MRNNSLFDRVFSTASWIIVLGLLVAVANLWLDAPTGLGPVAGALGVYGSQVFYTVLYGSLALSLGYAKIFKKHRMRKNTLLVIYLVGFFTTLLTVLLVGWNIKILDNLIIAITAAFCWLYWKFKTEYHDADYIEEESNN